MREGDKQEDREPFLSQIPAAGFWFGVFGLLLFFYAEPFCVAQAGSYNPA